MSSITVTLPEQAINCRSGDYLVHKAGASAWRVLWVEGFVLLSPLIPLGSSDSTEFIEEQHLRDSERPPRMGEIQVLVTWFHPMFESEAAAIKAIDHGELGQGVANVCVEIREYTKETTRAYRRAQKKEPCAASTAATAQIQPSGITFT